MTTTSRDKPIMEMDDLEFMRTFDELGRPLDEGMMAQARAGDASLGLCLLIATRPTGDRRVVFYTCEYGDDDGLDMGQELSLGLRKTLQKGETLERYVARFSLSDIRLVPAPKRSLCRPRAKDDPLLGLCLVVLTGATGQKSVPYYTCEHGDLQGVADVWGVLRGLRKCAVPGEVLERYVATFALEELQLVPVPLRKTRRRP